MVALAWAPAPQSAASGLSDRVNRLLERVDFRRADTSEDRDAIFRLRYAAYLREGAISSHASERFTDHRDEASNAWIFGVYIDGELASSIRLHVALQAQPDMPALDVFADLLAPEIARGRTVIDPTRFVADRDASRRVRVDLRSPIGVCITSFQVPSADMGKSLSRGSLRLRAWRGVRRSPQLAGGAGLVQARRPPWRRPSSCGGRGVPCAGRANSMRRSNTVECRNGWHSSSRSRATG